MGSHPEAKSGRKIDLASRAGDFKAVLDAARREARPGFEWYPYTSLSNAAHLARLLGERHDYVLEAGSGHGVLDLGCGDGDLSFFFETLGCEVTAVDHSPSNHNHMQGIRALQHQLKSSVTVREIDVDHDFLPLDRRFGLTLFLGTLYHLKNPFLTMERIARCSEYCLLSTKVARCFPGGSPIPKKHAIAYLVGENELNRDESNYWIFSETGLRRLIERTHWEILEYMSIGDLRTSDPATQGRDERAFCLLRSHYGLAHLELLGGWHPAEKSGWRWTERLFAARVRNRMKSRYGRLEMRVYVPPALFDKLGEITLVASVDGAELHTSVFSGPGGHEFVRRIPLSEDSTDISFRLDKALAPDIEDPRERGIIVGTLEIT